MKINCLIIESEKHNKELLHENLKRLNEFVIIGEVSDAIEGIEIIENGMVDLLILDLDLPDFSGIELLNTTVNQPKTIVLSSTPKFAINCFELNVIDYILKPLTPRRFIKALLKYRSSIVSRGVEIPGNFINESNDIFKLEINKTIYNIRLKDITYVESMREYIKIYFINDEPLVIKYVLSRLEEQLPKNLFVRIHKSYIISLRNIKLYTNKYIETSEKKIPIGSFYRKEVIGKLF